MGVSCCGKSMDTKVIASAWSLPPMRLYMNLVLAAAHWAPERALDHTLRQIAPMTLWIDDMENNFCHDSEGHRGNNPKIFSNSLIWMQKKPTGASVLSIVGRIQL